MTEFPQEATEQTFITKDGLMLELHVLVMEFLEMFVVFSLERTCLMSSV